MRLAIWLLLSAVAFGQVAPSHVLATEDLSDPTHPKVFVTFPSTGADSYRVYEALDVSLDFTCPVFGSTLATTQVWPDGSVHRAGSPAYVFDTAIPGGMLANSYSINYHDDPNPNLNQVPATSLDQPRGWCYAVSSVVNGVESAPSTPQVVWMGFNAYYSWSFHAKCGGSQVPYPLPITDYKPTLYYRDSAGVNHIFSYYANQVINDVGHYEIEFHLPVVANDGTMIPLLDASANGKAKYFVEMYTPDGYIAVEDILPDRQGDKVYYSEIGTEFLIGEKSYTKNCKTGDTPRWWQDTSY